MSEVLDPTYVPKPAEKADFNAKNTFIYSAFVQCLLSPKSKIALCAHENTKDGQDVYCDLVKAYSEGTTASLSAETMEENLRKMKANKSWNKPLTTFLNTWTLRLNDLETVHDKHFPDSEKREMLIKAIKTHEGLYSGVTVAKLVEQTVRAMTKEPGISFDRFFALVLDNAETIDSTTKQSRSQSANNTRTQPSKPPSEAYKKVQKLADFIPPEKWNAMSAAEKKAVASRHRKQKRSVAQAAQSPGTTPGTPDTVPPAPVVTVPPVSTPSRIASVPTAVSTAAPVPATTVAQTSLTPS